MKDDEIIDIMALERAEKARSENDRRARRWHARQYRPAYFTGFEDGVAYDLGYDEITTPPWFRNFEHDDFDRWEIEPYGAELIISAHYKDGQHWVAGFACDVTTAFARNFRYQPKEPRP